MGATVQLDKQFTTEAGETHGTISIRVIVLKPKAKDDKGGKDEEAAVPVESDDDFDDDSPKANSPLASYMEKTPEKRSPGKM
ncbi:MAG: hypothetical protein JO114_03495, partial [Planctomycetaceae bacterium]|nr:hypothetical protein [Planctomycetaceae bacterium]